MWGIVVQDDGDGGNRCWLVKNGREDVKGTGVVVEGRSKDYVGREIDQRNRDTKVGGTETKRTISLSSKVLYNLIQWEHEFWEITKGWSASPRDRETGIEDTGGPNEWWDRCNLRVHKQWYSTYEDWWRRRGSIDVSKESEGNEFVVELFQKGLVDILSFLVRVGGVVDVENELERGIVINGRLDGI